MRPAIFTNAFGTFDPRRTPLPAATMIADSLPRNGAGKVVKPALREAFLASPPRFECGNPRADVRGE